MKYLRIGFQIMKKLQLSKDVYSYEKLRKVKAIYSDYAQIHVVPEKKHWLVLFTRCTYGEDETVREFENYLIGLENT